MASLLLPIIYLAFISLGLPDALLGAAWPTMYPQLGAQVSWAGGVSMIISACTILSALASDRLNERLGTGRVTAISVAATAAALFGFSFCHAFWQLCLWAIPYGLGAGSVDAALNNYVALHYKSRHMSWLHCMWGVGASLGPVIMGQALAGSGWQGGYRIIGILQVVLTVVLCAQALLALGILGMVIDSISARIYPNEPSAYTAVAATERLDIRIPVGNDILRVYRISIGQADDTPGVWEAEVQLCAYDRIPGGIVSRRLMEQTWLETPGGRRDPPKGSGRGNWRVEYGSCYVRLSPEDTYVVLRFEAFDEQIRLELPLPEQEGL